MIGWWVEVYSTFTGTVHQIAGTVYQIAGTVYQTVGTVYQIAGTVYQNTGTVYQITGTVYQIAGTVYQTALQLIFYGAAESVVWGGELGSEVVSVLEAKDNICGCC